MNHQFPNNADALLASIFQPNSIDDAPQENHVPRTVNIYIDIQEDEEESQALPPTVEGTVETQNIDTTTIPLFDEEEQPAPPAPAAPTTASYQSLPPVPPTRRAPSMYPRLMVLLVALVGVLCTLMGMYLGVAVLPPLFAPSATVTLTTTSQHVTTASTLELVTSGNVNPTQHQLPGRALPALSMSRHQRVATTGIGHQDATAAHGLLTLYNSATYAQTAPAGTLITGTDGTAVVTNTDVTIPAASFPTFGQRSVMAHAVLVGSQGNIRAGDIYGACCHTATLSAVSSAFTGGQNARTYQTVAPQDIEGVVNSIHTSLEQHVQSALHAQVQPTETLVTPLACTQKVTPDHAVGTEAVAVTVTLEETCTGNVYETQAFTTMTTQDAVQSATAKLGTGYTPTELQTSITGATRTPQGTIALHVLSHSVWAYQYSSPEQEQRIKAMIAGMQKDKAQATVLHLVGVQRASVTLTNNGTTIPNDTTKIHLLFIQM